MLEKLSEIEAREYARRDCAARYEKLSDEADRLRAEVARLEGATPAGADALEQIAALTARVDPGLVTSGRHLAIPGGLAVRAALETIVADALTDATRRQQKAEDRLATARAKLAEAEAALKQFE